MPSVLERVASLPKEKKKQWLNQFSDDELEVIMHDIAFVGREDQQPPKGDWDVCLALCGRGWGKSFFGAHWVIEQARRTPGCRIALVGMTVADVRDVMVRGDSGILRWSSKAFMPEYIPSNRLITWPNGSIAQTYSADAWEQLRGPQFHYAWVDELAKFQYANDVWDMLQFCMRLGDHPKVVVTTTPRPIKLVKELAEEPTTHIITGTTFDNTALPDKFKQRLIKQYDGTRIGQQELYAKILDDNPNSLFQQSDIDECRIRFNEQPGYDIEDEAPRATYDRIVVAIDPATTNSEESDETGIVVAGIYDDEGYVLEDGSVRDTPSGWAKTAVKLYHKYQADVIIGETNNGGDMIEALIRNHDRNVNYKKITATRGKALRAEPIAGLYEQKRIHHVGNLIDLEQQMVSFDPTLGRNQKSPDRVDALVYALQELFDNTEELFIEQL